MSGDATKHLVATEVRGLDGAVPRATLEWRPQPRRKGVEEMARLGTADVLHEGTKDGRERVRRRHLERQADAPWDVTEQLVLLAFTSRLRRSFDGHSFDGHSSEDGITRRAIGAALQSALNSPILRTMPKAWSAGCP